MNLLKKFRKAFLLILTGCSLHEGKAMQQGLRKRPTRTLDRLPLLAPSPSTATLTFLGLCEPLAVLGSQSGWARSSRQFIVENKQLSSLKPVFGLRPVLINFANNSNVGVEREIVGKSGSCNYTMMPLNVTPGQMHRLLFNAPAVFTNRSTVFVTFTFPSSSGQMKRLLIGVTLAQSFPGMNHSARILVRIDDSGLTNGFSDVKEGNAGPNQSLFDLVRQDATGSHSVAQHGNFGVVAVIGQSEPWSSLADCTVINVVFIDRESLLQQLGVAPEEPAGPPSEGPMPPSRAASQPCSANQ